MKEKMNQMFKDKLFLVMLVLGLLTIVAAAGVVTIQRGSVQEENPYMQDPGTLIAEENQLQSEIQIAGDSNADKENGVNASDQTGDSRNTGMSGNYAAENGAAGNAGAGSSGSGNGSAGKEEQSALAGAGNDAAVPLVLDFADTSRIAWPVRGNVLLDYSMDTTIYFPTLDQYQCNPGVVIQAEVSQPVVSPANARVVSVSADEELGNYVVLDFGNDYIATCGQLKEVQVVENEYLEAGQILGYVAEPTKYYSLEGSNVYFELQHEGKAVDPMGYFE